MVTVALAPEAIEGKLAVTVPAFRPALPPVDAFAETNATFAGNVCAIATLVAVLGPLFVTVNVYVRVCPTRTGSVGALASSERSAESAGAPETVTSIGIEQSERPFGVWSSLMLYLVRGSAPWRSIRADTCPELSVVMFATPNCVVCGVPTSAPSQSRLVLVSGNPVRGGAGVFAEQQPK